MPSRTLLSQVTATSLAALALVALLALGDFSAFQLAAATQSEHQVLSSLSSRQLRLGEQTALLAALLTVPEEASATRADLRRQLRATGTELATNQRRLHAAQPHIPWWVTLVVPLATDYPVTPPDVETLLDPFLRHLEALAATPDAQLSTTQTDRIALVLAHDPLVLRLQEAEAWYEQLGRIDTSAIIRLQILTMSMVFVLLIAETVFIFRPLFRRLADEQDQMALLSLVASQTDNGVMITDAHGKVVWVNDGFTRIAGYTLSELVGHKPGTILQGPATDRATVKLIVRAIRAGEAITAELVNYHKSGRPYWLSLAITPIRGAEKSVARFIAIQSDVTARKAMEASLHASLKDLADVRFALDQAAIIAITDPQGVIIEVNDFFCQISGYSRDELIGQTHHIINANYHDPTFWHEFWTTIAQGKVWRGEVCNRTKDGAIYWVAATVVPVFDEAGQPIRYIAMRFDISQRKLAEEALRERTLRLQLRADIAAMVRGATKDAMIIAGVITELARHFPTLRVAYATIDDAGQMTIFNGAAPATGLPAQAGSTVDLTKVPAYLAAMRAGETLESADVNTDPRLAPLMAGLHAHGTAAILAVPVAYSATFIGLLGFDTPEPHRWSAHETVTLREVADYLRLLLHEAYIQRERERAEAALRASEAHLRFQKTLLECQSEASPDGLLVVGPDGHLLSMNRRFAQLWGLPETLFTHGTFGDGMSLVAALVENEGAHFTRLKELLANPMMVATDELRLRDGRTFERYTAPVRGADGEYFGRFWSYRDITERFVAEAALRASEATNRALLDALPDMMFRLRTDGMFLSYRASHLNDLLLPPEQFLGHRVSEVMPAELARMLMLAVQATIETDTLQLVEYDLPLGDEVRDYEARVTRIRADEVLVIVRDISERKAGDRLKNEFVAMVSHELRTPLTAIRGSLGLIAGGVAGELSPQARAMIDIAYKNSERLVRLINDLLDIEKIESGQMSFQRQPIELGHLLAQTIEANSAYGAHFGVSFVLTPAPKLQVFADADRLMQVFTNLLSNAAKFSPSGEVVRVWLGQHAGMVRVGVSDCGPGIPEAFREQIFQKFAQADSSSTRTKGGTGLGLNIARAIVERHGGKVSFETQTGVGTTFFVDLPAWRPIERIEQVVTPLLAGRILVCEDDPDVAHLLTLMLQRIGFAVDVVYTADEMRARLAVGCYDLLTLDIRLQHQDGVELIRELRRHTATANLPIIVISGQIERARTTLGTEQVGPLDWLSKPINPAQLVAAVTQAVHHAKSLTPRLLHIDDDPDTVHVVAELLGATVTLVHAASVAAARACLAEGQYDLALLDLAFTDGSGLELLPLLRAQYPPIPVVIFSVHELAPTLTGQVAATLIKSRVTNAELRATIMRLLAIPEPSSDHPSIQHSEEPR